MKKVIAKHKKKLFVVALLLAIVLVIANATGIMMLVYYAANIFSHQQDDTSEYYRTSSDIYPNGSITLLSPNGGETFAAGQKIDVSWKTQNIPATEEVDILFDSLVFATTNTGAYTFAIPSNYPGGNYKIEAAVIDSPIEPPIILDLSNKAFTVTNSNSKCLATFPSLSLSLNHASPKRNIEVGSKNVELARFDLTSSSNCSNIINQMTVVDCGPGLAHNLKIYDTANNLIGEGINDDYQQFTFNLLNSPLVIPSSSTKVLIVRGDIQQDICATTSDCSSMRDVFLELAMGDWFGKISGVTDKDSGLALNEYNISTTPGQNKAHIHGNGIRIAGPITESTAGSTIGLVWWQKILNFFPFM